MWRLCAERSPSPRRAGIELLEPLGDDPELARALSSHAFTTWSDDPEATEEMLLRADGWPSDWVTTPCAATS
jgi:hypothetical protein